MLIPLVLGLSLIASGVLRLKRGRLLGATGRTAGGALLVAVGGLGMGTSVSLHTYDRLNAETPVAVVRFVQMEPQRFRAELVTPEGRTRSFTVSGDQWQLDARILKWQGSAVLSGLDALYRLERLSGRYAEVEQELGSERSVYGLAEDPGLDLWRLAREHGRWLPFVDARYGSATYMPMADGAVYEVSLSQSGLIARPANAAAEAAAEAW